LGVPIINAAEFAAFVLVLLRLSMMVVLAPIYRNSSIPAQVKALLALMLAFVIAPQVEYSADMMPMTWFGFIFLGLEELMIGAALALMIRLVLDSANVAGFYMSMQMGLSMLNTMDPQSDTQAPTLAMLVNLFLTLIFLYADGHLLIIKAMADSFKVAPPGLINSWRPEIFTELVMAMTGMYILAVKICAPVVAVLFVVKVAFGIVAKAVPQMNIMFVGIPMYIIVGFSVMGFGMPWWPQLLGRYLLIADQAMSRIIGYLGPAI